MKILGTKMIMTPTIRRTIHAIALIVNGSVDISKDTNIACEKMYREA
jgi:hypothetical protein